MNITSSGVLSASVMYRLPRLTRARYDAEVRKTRRSGVVGVYWVPHRDKCWRAQFLYGGKIIYVGHFDTVAEAEAALNVKRAEYGLPPAVQAVVCGE